MKTKSILMVAILFTGLLSFAQTADKQFNNLNDKGVIIDGYDPVAFFTDSQPLKGDEKFNYSYNGAKYFFASQEHLDLFKADPAKYAPQFGGWCAYAVSLGRVAPVNVEFWSIVDGRLLLQHNKRANDGWNKDVKGNLTLADQYWPAVSSKKGGQIVTAAEKAFYNNVDKEGVSIGGYDPVAYFTMNQPVEGNKDFFARFEGATYWFSSQANADMFKNNPKMFAPKYGGFCGYAMSDGGRRRPVNPKLFSIVDGQLILQHSQGAVDLWNKDIAGQKSKADNFWPTVVTKFHGQKTAFD